MLPRERIACYTMALSRAPARAAAFVAACRVTTPALVCATGLTIPLQSLPGLPVAASALTQSFCTVVAMDADELRRAKLELEDSVRR